LNGYFYMNPTQGNTLSPELQAALAARSQGQAPQGQLNQTAATAAPSLPQSNSFNAMPSQGQPSPEAPATPEIPQPEVQILEKALMDRIKHISNLEKASAGLSKPQGTSQPSIEQMPVG
jgi:hypothetical protein